MQEVAEDGSESVNQKSARGDTPKKKEKKEKEGKKSKKQMEPESEPIEPQVEMLHVVETP